jgi:coenzyme F420-reducing hydrogenase alpha subunit
VPDITARICGICPVAYQTAACQALEDALGLELDPRLHDLRRLLMCGEWIESHALHMLLLHAPDFLGYPDGVALARAGEAERERVAAGLRLKQIGNALMTAIGGREIHPVNVRVGGFYSLPRRRTLDALLPDLEWARGAAAALLEWFSGFAFPDPARPPQEVERVALRHPIDYPMLQGRLVSSAGLDLAVRDYDAHFVERQVDHSTALHSLRRPPGGDRDRGGEDGSPYLCGPLARFDLNFDRLPAEVRAAAKRAGLAAPCANPFKSLLVRAVETLYACGEALRLVQAYSPPARPGVEVPRRAATGHGCVEAPRGILYHRYTVDEGGLVRDARIVPPTSQNQRAIELDLESLAPRLLELPAEEARHLAEQAVRNHDPCISCATHFLRLRVVEGDF